MSNSKPVKSVKKSKKTKKINEESTLYYFRSVGCAFCKQIDPIIEKLNKEDKNILVLDMEEPDNQGLHREIENKYDLRCGTPWLIDVSNGNSICGMRDEETIKDWANKQMIPSPPQPKGPPPPLPDDFENEEQVKAWKDGFEEWKKENNHMSNLPDTDEVFLKMKHQRELGQQQQANSPDGSPIEKLQYLCENRVNIIEDKLNKLMNHLGVK
tara:strand:- start:345 stop:980 length:636 start_codon:yes stop_codon:yes gene_type:complete